MTRFGTLVATIGAAGAFGTVVAGGSPLAAAPFLALALLGAAAGRVARRGVPDGPWASRTASGSMLPIAERPGPPTVLRVAREVRRVEARELALQPWFGAGIGLCTFMALGFGLAGNADGAWENELQDVTLLAHPLVGTTVLASHAAMTRSNRSGTDELLACCPATRSTRTLGTLGSMWVASAALAVFIATYVASLAVSNPDLTAPAGPVALHVASALTLGAGGVALGVALGRWVRLALAPVAAIVAVGFASARLAEGTGDRVEPTMLLSTLPPLSDPTVLVTGGQMAWHLLWLLAITAATCGVALLRSHGVVPSLDVSRVTVGAGA